MTDWIEAFKREMQARIELAKKYEALRREHERLKADVEMARRVAT